jgi:F-type H+-transporting ATPase subunit epsilon
MILKVLVPGEVFLEKEVLKVTAEAVNGSFCLLPRHVDFLTYLVPGIISFELKEGKEEFLATDEGLLLKRGRDIIVSVKDAVRGEKLGTLKNIVDEHFRHLDDRQKRARSVLVKLEADFVRRFMETK